MRKQDSQAPPSGARRQFRQPLICGFFCAPKKSKLSSALPTPWLHSGPQLQWFACRAEGARGLTAVECSEQSAQEIATMISSQAATREEEAAGEDGMNAAAPIAGPPEEAASHVPVKVAGRLPRPSTVRSDRVMWDYTVSLVAMHLLALLVCVPWLFSWAGVIVFLIGMLFYGQGMTFCYHRLLTHRSLVVPKWLERFWVMVALCCLEDTPCKWVTAHRHHHRHSDQQEDPHSPLVSFFWSHFQWLTRHNSDTRNMAAYDRYARDILADPFYMAMEKSRWIAPAIYVAHALLYFVGGLLGGLLSGGTLLSGVQLGLSLLVWGVILRTVLIWHITWSVNSVTHTWGYRNYDTPEHSRNNWLVALFAVGEGWHNNHHHDQASASNQHRWWEFDPTYYHIKLLRWLGLATKVIEPSVGKLTPLRRSMPRPVTRAPRLRATLLRASART